MTFKIEPICLPDGEDNGHCHCDESDATRWMVVDAKGHPRGHFASRDLAEVYIEELNDRSKRFVWGDGDVEHHE